MDTKHLSGSGASTPNPNISKEIVSLPYPLESKDVNTKLKYTRAALKDAQNRKATFEAAFYEESAKEAALLSQLEQLEFVAESEALSA